MVWYFLILSTSHIYIYRYIYLYISIYIYISISIYIYIGRFPEGSRPGLGTQPRYVAIDDRRVKIVQDTVINIGLVRLSPRELSKVVVGQPNSC